MYMCSLDSILFNSRHTDTTDVPQFKVLILSPWRYCHIPNLKGSFLHTASASGANCSCQVVTCIYDLTKIQIPQIRLLASSSQQAWGNARFLIIFKDMVKETDEKTC